MLTKLVRTAGLLGLLLGVSVPSASAANPDEIDKAIKDGAAALKRSFSGNTLPSAPAGQDHALGGACLAGLALLESNTAPDDASVKAITAIVREESYSQIGTYQVALCLMFMDRLKDPADVPRIQMLAARLLVGQGSSGGWGYKLCAAPQPDRAKKLRAMVADQPGKFHPDAEEYLQELVAGRAAAGGQGEDNSNTQFALLAVWMSRKYGAPAAMSIELSLDAVARRFAAQQDLQTGNWPYSGAPLNTPGAPKTPNGSPSMYCAGLLAMATAVARREEKKNELPVKPPPKAKVDPAKPLDPFYNPPPPTAPPPKKDEAAKGPDVNNVTVQLAFRGLGAVFADQVNSGRGMLPNLNLGHGHFDMYFLWSLERVCVIYGMDRVGGKDWHDIGSTALVKTQGKDGHWTNGGYHTEANTAFAVLFLCRSNLARDLSGKVQRDPTNTEMRAGVGSPTEGRPTGPAAPAAPVIELPNPNGDAAIAQASKVLKASGAGRAKLLADARDNAGAINTRALVVLAMNTDGDEKKEVRDALAERLCRMTPDTLRGMLKGNEPELRRAAALACAMKEDRSHIPDLVGAMSDGEATVVRAARAGLKSLTGQEFATAAEWRDWLDKQK